MTYAVYITETNVTAAFFDTKEEAEQFMNEPDYDLCNGWKCIDSKIELVENKWLCLKRKLPGLMN